MSDRASHTESLDVEKNDAHYENEKVLEGAEAAVVPAPAAAAAPPQLKGGPPVFPEGGARGWLAVLGCWCVMFMTFGYMNAFGYVSRFLAIDWQANSIQNL
jgi:hypothetical protein